jgi:hypothetical protein
MKRKSRIYDPMAPGHANLFAYLGRDDPANRPRVRLSKRERALVASMVARGEDPRDYLENLLWEERQLIRRRRERGS